VRRIYGGTPEDFEKLDVAVLTESKKSPAKTVLVCPQCGSRNVTYWLGLKAGFCQYQ
jgi:DNA-directed RNA polymerase subunit M/transcription elongation factor TFIIS